MRADDGISSEILKNEEHVIDLRRKLHENPEISMHEHETSAMIRAELAQMGIPYRMAGELGVISELVMGRGGKTVLLRADIDALPMDEEDCNLKQKKKCVSGRPGAAHTCGHDAHTAMLLGTARALSACRDLADGRVLFCFEQGEEVGGGWQDMIDALQNERVDAAWAIHVTPLERAGTFSVSDGPRTAGSIYMDITVHGKGAHGAYPNLAHDPLLCAAEVISSFSHVFAREIAPGTPATMSIGSFHAGVVGNIIPETANFKGTARFYDRETSAQMEDGIRRHINSICSKHRCTPSYDVFNISDPSVNDKRMSALASKALEAYFGENLICSPPMMGTESFAKYLVKWPGVLAFLGVGNESDGSLGTVMHNPKFDIDESTLKLGSLASARFALAVFGEEEENN